MKKIMIMALQKRVCTLLLLLAGCVILFGCAKTDFAKGKELADQAKYSEAIPFLEKALSKQPDSKDTLYYLFVSYSKTETSVSQESKTYRAAEKLVKLYPDGDYGKSAKEYIDAALPKTIINSKDGSELILIPAGEFTMGSSDEEADAAYREVVKLSSAFKKEWFTAETPQHRIYLNEYYIGKTEVTNEQFDKFVNETEYNAGGEWMNYYNSGTADHPVVCISWNDAKAYCDWAGLRLATEAEWEKATRGADGRKYPWGDSWDSSRCNWPKGPKLSGMADIFGGRGTLPVGSFPSGASPYSCLDMAGNVWEWCSDWYGEKYYSQSTSSDPQGPLSGSKHILRGGSWADGSADLLRCATRNGDNPVGWGVNIGFRVCRSANTR